MIKISISILVFSSFLAEYVTGTLNICYYRKNVTRFSQGQNNAHLGMHDTIYLGTQRINFTHPAISLDILFNNLTVSHLTNFQPGISFTNNLTLNLTFPHIFAEGEYDLKGNIGDLFDIFGKGHFRGRFFDFSIALKLNYFSNSSAICVPTTIDVRLGKFRVHFTNFMGDKEMEKLMNKAFSSIVPEIIRVFWEEMREDNDAEIEKWINSQINGIPVLSSLMEELLEMETPSFENNSTHRVL